VPPAAKGKAVCVKTIRSLKGKQLEKISPSGGGGEKKKKPVENKARGKRGVDRVCIAKSSGGEENPWKSKNKNHIRTEGGREEDRKQQQGELGSSDKKS